MAKLPDDKRILHIAAEVAETTDSNVPILLLGLEDILSDYSIGTPGSRQIKEDLWNYDLTHVTNLALKQDFVEIEGAWATAAKLSSILTASCAGFLPRDEAEYKKEFLPDVIDSLLTTASRIQENIARTKQPPSKQELLQHFRIVLQGVTKMFEYYKFLTAEVISSKRYLQLLMSEEERTSLTMMVLTQNILKANRNVILELNEFKIYSIIDELVFKISVTSNVSIASTATRLLLLSIDLHPPLADVVSSKRYKGLKTYLSKWKGKGFTEDIQRLTDILEAKSAQQLEMMRNNRAAATIQAAYKGYKTRQRLKMAVEGITKFQRIMRERKRQREQANFIKTETKRMISMEASRRKKEVISSRTKQLKVIETIPASTVTKFLEDLQSESAVRIQSSWRGYKTRKKLELRLTEIKKIRAAVRIQRQVRRWLTRCRVKRAALMTELLPPGLNDKRRVELQGLISKMRDRFPPKQRTYEELKDLNEETFRKLNSHYIDLRKMRRREQHREALLAQLSVDAEQLMAAPKLHEATATDVELFSSKSGPVIAAARRQHSETLRRLKQPWWQKFADEEEADLFGRPKVDIADLKLDDSELEKQF